MNVHLVAEPADQPALRTVIDGIVGCSVSLVSPLAEGARDLLADPPDAVVVAIPDGDARGTHVLRALRTLVPRPLSIALIDRDTPEARAAAKRAGADYCFDRSRALSPFTETLEILAMAKGAPVPVTRHAPPAVLAALPA